MRVCSSDCWLLSSIEGLVPGKNRIAGNHCCTMAQHSWIVKTSNEFYHDTLVLGAIDWDLEKVADEAAEREYKRQQAEQQQQQQAMCMCAASPSRSSLSFLRHLEVCPAVCARVIVLKCIRFRSLLCHWLQCRAHPCRLRAACRHSSAPVSFLYYSGKEHLNESLFRLL